jgi:hypothetical protein
LLFKGLRHKIKGPALDDLCPETLVPTTGTNNHLANARRGRGNEKLQNISPGSVRKLRIHNGQIKLFRAGQLFLGNFDTLCRRDVKPAVR